MTLLLRPNLELLRREYAIGRGLESPMMQLLSPSFGSYAIKSAYHTAILLRQKARMGTTSIIERNMQASYRSRRRLGRCPATPKKCLYDSLRL